MTFNRKRINKYVNQHINYPNHKFKTETLHYCMLCQKKTFFIYDYKLHHSKCELCGNTLKQGKTDTNLWKISSPPIK
jgi:hypothetical protein